MSGGEFPPDFVAASRDLAAAAMDSILAQICYALGLRELADELTASARRRVAAASGNEPLDRKGQP